MIVETICRGLERDWPGQGPAGLDRGTGWRRGGRFFRSRRLDV